MEQHGQQGGKTEISREGEFGSRKLILLELNEVPYKVIDWYCERRPRSALAAMLSRSSQYDTVTEDAIALDPWISWSTLHRGVHDEVHNILHLGQVLADTDAKYPPIWQMLNDSGFSVGVFGSLHSSQVPSNVAKFCFYVPDYFHDEAFAHPSELLPFQELNLRMTRQSARNVTRKIPFSSTLKFAVQAPRLGLGFSTVLDSTSHLLREAFNSSLRIRRRAYQPLVAMDLFLHQMERQKPQFATFYTNHVAAAMHRYWAAAFPEDYHQDAFDTGWLARYKSELLFAMDKCDKLIKRLSSFLSANPAYVLMVASSMGQAAIPATQTDNFLTISDLPRFMNALGVPHDAWLMKPAMVPCWGIVISEDYRAVFSSSLRGLTIAGQSFKRAKSPTEPLSYNEQERGFFQIFMQFDNYAENSPVLLDGRSLSLSDLGLGLMAHEDGVNCTAKHIPNGSLWTYSNSKSSTRNCFEARNSISTLDVVPSILKFFGLDKPCYMRGSPTINFAL